MTVFVARRVIWGASVMLAVAIVAFLLTFIAPTNPAKSIAGPNSTAAAVERIRVALGLDQPPLEQLARYLGGLLRLDLGTSYQTGGRPVADLILGKMPATLELAVAGLALGLLVGIPLGVVAARHRGGRRDRGASVMSAVMVAVPSFLVGIILLHVFAYRLRMDAGIELFSLAETRWRPLDFSSLALPAITLALATAPFYIRITRTVMSDELHRDHIRTARAKGLADRTVTWRHAFRNALPIIITQIGLDLGFLLGGVVVIEAVFSWPGIGQQAVMAITDEDLPMLMGTLLMATGFIVLASIVVDIVYAVLDPRVTAWGGDR